MVVHESATNLMVHHYVKKNLLECLNRFVKTLKELLIRETYPSIGKAKAVAVYIQDSVCNSNSVRILECP